MVSLGLAGYDLDRGRLSVGNTGIVCLYWPLRTKGKKVFGGLSGPILLHVCGLDDLDLLSIPSWRIAGNTVNNNRYQRCSLWLKGMEEWLFCLTDLTIFVISVAHGAQPRHWRQ